MKPKDFLNPGWLGLLVAAGALAVSVLAYLEGRETRRLQEEQWEEVRRQVAQEKAEASYDKMAILAGVNWYQGSLGAVWQLALPEEVPVEEDPVIQVGLTVGSD